MHAARASPDNRGVDERPLDPIRQGLSTSYGIDVRAFAVPPGGKDPVARSYVAPDAMDRRYLVKVRPSAAPRRIAAEASAALRDAGLPYVVAPLRSLSGSVSAAVGDISITVTPFVDAAPAMFAG